jgi:hypothetical protein
MSASRGLAGLGWGEIRVTIIDRVAKRGLRQVTSSHTSRRLIWAALALCIAAQVLGPAAFGQTEGGGKRAADELATDNSAVVGASADQISAVLRRDPGLLLEVSSRAPPWLGNKLRPVSRALQGRLRRLLRPNKLQGAQ